MILEFSKRHKSSFWGIHPLQLTTGRFFEVNSCQTQLIWLIEYWIILRSFCIPSLKLARSWKWLGRRLFPFGANGLFSGANLLLFFKEANFPEFFPPAKLTMEDQQFQDVFPTHTIHVWYIYLHLPYKSTKKCRWGFSSDPHVNGLWGRRIFDLRGRDPQTPGRSGAPMQVVVNYVPLVSKSKNF